MEIDDLKAAWSDVSTRLDGIEANAHAARRAGAISGVRTRLRIAGAGLVVQALIGLALTVLGGSFWFDQRSEIHLVLAGMAVHLFGVLVIATAVGQLAAWRALAFDGSIRVVQSRVAQLRIRRAHAERGLLLAGLVLWAPATLMICKSMGLDLWRISPAYVWANVAFGIAAALVLAAAMRRWPVVFENLGVGGGLRRAEHELAQFSE